ncbi:MAG: glycosyltransferase family 39 protein [Polyangiaceae bacterium]|nr:glycosyltransferase family 39 protein [Polyangiaceae bacterium]
MTTSPAPKTTRFPIDGGIAIAIAVSYAIVLLRTTHDLGYARDEGFYFQAAQAYGKWFDLLFSNWRAAIDLKSVDAAWAANNEHPGLIKSLFALSHLVLHKKLHLFSMEGTSFRFPGIALASAGVALVYRWGAQARSRLAGFIAAALLAAMPRFFYHAHLACFDAPIVTMWMLCAYCYWRALRSSGALWPILCGIAFGLALDTKHNSWFLPFAFIAHAALVHIRNRFLYAGRGESPPENKEAKRALLALACMAAIGPAVLYALWPWLWRDPVGRFRNYALFHLHHEYYNMEFLGRNYWIPPMPRSYAWLMTAATVPAVTLALGIAGLWARARASFVPPLVRAARLLVAWKKRADAPPPSPPSQVSDARASTDLLWFLGIAVAYAPWLSSNTPIFGGTKHWMTAYPFLALFAGAGFCSVVAAARRVLARASEKKRRPIALTLARAPYLPAILAACVLAAPVVETARSHPWGLSSYTPLVGGAAGAATLGLNRTFWGYTTGSVVDYLNREVKKGGTVYIHDTAGQAWDMMVRDGRLRRDIRASWTIAGADFGLYHHELHMQGQEHQNWVAFGTVAPAYIGGLDGVPVILVYRRPDAAPPPR